jgi:regulator of protease activity HflC (stomatin/prohibitin superfamily)
MPGLFIFAIIFLVVATIGLLAAAAARHYAKGASPTDQRDLSQAKWTAGIVGSVFLVGAALAVLFSSFNPVGTYDIGVTTSFGKVLSYVGPGAHFIAPWENMSLMDESVQQTDYTLTVRVAGQQTAKAEVKFRWQVLPAATDPLFKQYKGSTAQVATALVKPSLNVAMNSVYDGYDPILPLSTGAKAGTPENPSTAQLSQKVQTALSQRIGQQVKIDTLIVEPLQYDDTVTQRINSVLSQTAQTDKAREAVKTAEQQAAAYQKAASSINKDPMVLVKQCLDEIENGQLNPPAGFSCWPGANSGVVIPATGK